jgi:hypothetical protein
MPESIPQLRAQARQFSRGKTPTGVRYPAAFRAAVTGAARRQRAQGAPAAQVARELGVSPASLGRWLQRPPRPVLRPVTVTAEIARPAGPAPTAGGPILITPQGVRVEGLDRDTLIAVLRGLA